MGGGGISVCVSKYCAKHSASQYLSVCLAAFLGKQTFFGYTFFRPPTQPPLTCFQWSRCCRVRVVSGW